MNHLTQIERYHIYQGLKAGKSQSLIARELERSKSTISEEISRNRGCKGYRYKQAEEKAQERWKSTHGKSYKMHGEVLELIEEYLSQDWSPEQISGYLLKHHDLKIHHETIYQYIYDDKKNRGTLYKHLRRSNRVYKKRYGSGDRRGKLKDRVDIDQRPKEVEKRKKVGHWEGDTVYDKPRNRSLVTLVERSSRVTIIEPVDSLHADKVADAIIARLKPLQDSVLSLTLDNGTEFAAHKRVGEKLNADIYFAKPYHSWERGTNENTNGLIRQYFPKRKVKFTREIKSTKEVESMLNNRPRKTLGFMTPLDFIKRKNIEFNLS